MGSGKAAEALRLTDAAEDAEAAPTAMRPWPTGAGLPAGGPAPQPGWHRCRPSPDHSRRAAHGVPTGEGSIRTRGDPGGLVQGSWALAGGDRPPRGAAFRGISEGALGLWVGLLVWGAQDVSAHVSVPRRSPLTDLLLTPLGSHVWYLHRYLRRNPDAG